MKLHDEGVRAALAGVWVNALLAGVKIVTGIAGNSYALIADGIESSADILSSLIVMGGIRLSARPADDNHPYGHGKAESLASVVVSLLLLAAAVWIGISSIREIRHPHHAPEPFTLVVLALVILVKEILSRRVQRVGERLGSTAVRGDAWHHRSDALTSLAAFIGISIALLGGPGYEAADDYAALAACSVIVFNGVRLLLESINELMDAAVAPELISRLRQVAGDVPGVLAIEKFRVRKSGLELTMDVHVVVDGDMSVRQGHDIGHEVRDRLCAADPRVMDVMVHIEPHDAPHRPQRRDGLGPSAPGGSSP